MTAPKTPESRWQALDRKVVPVAAARLRRAVDSVGALPGRGRQRLRTALRLDRAARPAADALPDVTALPPALPPAQLPAQRPWRRLDERFAARGPLALVREVPQVGVLVIAAVFLTGSGVALTRSGPEPGAPGARTTGDVTGGGLPVVGPEPGVGVADYIEASRARVADLNAAEPSRRYAALVSFSAYAKVEDIARLLGPVRARVVYTRIKGAGRAPEVLSITVADLVPDALAGYRTAAERKAAEQKEQRGLAASITSTDPGELQFKADYLEAAETSGKEAAAYRTSCRCVFAALVEATARELSDLFQLPGVRAVDVAPAGTRAGEVVIGEFFLPEDAGTVPVRPSQLGGSGVPGVLEGS